MKLDNLSVRHGGRDVLRHVTLSLSPGEVVGLIGPNGAGKTTLMRASLGLLPSTGASTLAALSVRERAKAAAFLPQTRDIAWPVSVRTLVTLGRTPYLAGGRKLSGADVAAVDAALDRLDLLSLADRPATELSGGELARALIARTVAQDAPLIIADEPTAGLDPAQQLNVMRLFQDLAQDGRTVFVALHELPLAARYTSRIVLLHNGSVVADGTPRDVLTNGNLQATFGITGLWTGDGHFLVDAVST